MANGDTSNLELTTASPHLAVQCEPGRKLIDEFPGGIDWQTGSRPKSEAVPPATTTVELLGSQPPGDILAGPVDTMLE
ncbi:MAG: hypothetical protein ACYC23_19845 [Limisphaerales bacterium]